MKGIALITGINRAFDEKLSVAFVREGFRVFALGDKPVNGVALLGSDIKEAVFSLDKQEGKLDFLLDTTDISDPKDDFTIRGGLDAIIIEKLYRDNVIRSMTLLEAFLPLLEKGGGKRLFYITSAKASINETCSKANFAYNMSKAALHQFLQMARNKLAPNGYTFRVFDPLYDEVSSEAAAESAYNYITRRRGTENHNPLRDDEGNLVFRDAFGRQHSW